MRAEVEMKLLGETTKVRAVEEVVLKPAFRFSLCR